MSHDNNITFITQVERTTAVELARQADLFVNADLTRLLDFVPVIILILNKEHQTVYGNKAALDHFHSENGTGIIGLRMGELVKCRNASITGKGCGTAPFCRYCGGLDSVLKSIQDNVVSEEECHLLAHNGCSEEALDLSIKSSPFEFNNERFTLLALAETAAEQRKISLERLLQHDILNAGLALRGFSELISGGTLAEGQRSYMQQRIEFLAKRIIDEINDQRQLMAAENNELVPKIKRIDSLDFLKTLVGTYNHEAVLDGKILRINADSESVAMTTDEQLLSQVIGNMIKNALEASHSGETVTIGCALLHGMVHFTVTNPTFIPEKIRAKIFSRSFSSKDYGKGLGTYSIKYLTEKYLRGSISFVSDEHAGTTFTAAYPLEL